MLQLQSHIHSLFMTSLVGDRVVSTFLQTFYSPVTEQEKRSGNSVMN